MFLNELAQLHRASCFSVDHDTHTCQLLQCRPRHTHNQRAVCVSACSKCTEKGKITALRCMHSWSFDYAHAATLALLHAGSIASSACSREIGDRLHAPSLTQSDWTYMYTWAVVQASGVDLHVKPAGWTSEPCLSWLTTWSPLVAGKFQVELGYVIVGGESNLVIVVVCNSSQKSRGCAPGVWLDYGNCICCCGSFRWNACFWWNNP